MTHGKPLTRYAWLSIGAAVLTMGLKGSAYALTGSVGLLSDALESGINLAAALLALWALTIAARPPDEEHVYGHGKAEYFSSGVEGGLIVVAAVSIIWAGVQRLLHPRPLEQLGVGLAISVVASLVNLGAALILRRAGRRHHSIALEADAEHLLSDVWTSVAVLSGVGAVALTGWQPLDSLLAIGVAFHIALTGYQLVHRSALGLMDTALPQEEVEAIQRLLSDYAGRGVRHHALRTRRAGSRCFISMHLMVPGDWTIQQGHDLAEEVEHRIQEINPRARVFTHVEPLEDPRSWGDQHIDRIYTAREQD